MPLQFLSHISQTLLFWGSGVCWLAVQLPKAELFSLNKAKVPQYRSCNTSGIGESANTSFPKNVLLPLLVWNLTSIFITSCSKLPLLPSGDSFFLIPLTGKSQNSKEILSFVRRWCSERWRKASGSYRWLGTEQISPDQLYSPTL